MFSLRKTSNYIHKYSQIAFASDWVANAKKGARTSLFPRSPHLFSLVHPISFLLHTPYFCHPHRPTRMLVTVGADARNGRRGCSYRPTRMLVSVGADARNDRRGWLLLMFRSAKLLLSCSQTFTFVLPNRCFCGSRPSFPYLPPSFSCNIFLCFPRSVVLSCCVHPLVAVLKTVSRAYNNIMCASTKRCFNCKQLLKQA